MSVPVVLQSVSAVTSARCATFVLPRAPLVRLIRPAFSPTHAGVSTDRPSPFASSIVFSSFPQRAPLAGLPVIPALVRPYGACPSTDRPNRATTASLLAPSEASSSFPTSFTRLTRASTVPAVAHSQVGVSTVISSSVAFRSFHFPRSHWHFHPCACFLRL